MSFIITIFRNLFVSLSNIWNTEYGEIYKMYDANHCMIRYNMLYYKKERIKEITIPKYIDKNMQQKIFYDITNATKNRRFHIRRLRKEGSIYLYDTDELVNNNINNVIIGNLIDERDNMYIARLGDQHNVSFEKRNVSFEKRNVSFERTLSHTKKSFNLFNP